jgi:hypothetical protein
MGDIRPPYPPEQQATIESRPDLHRAEGTLFRITLTPPGTQQRTDKPLLLRALGISADEFATRFCCMGAHQLAADLHPLRELAAAP